MEVDVACVVTGLCAAVPLTAAAKRSFTCLSFTACGGAISRTERAAKIGSRFSIPNGSSKSSA